jgi:hypothetical protein
LLLVIIDRVVFTCEVIHPRGQEQTVWHVD